jgi:hypothetical protein
MPANLDSMPFGSAEAKERTGGDRRWPIRSNLMRIKRPDKVHYSPYEPALKNHGGAVPIPAQTPPASPFDCADAGPYSVTDECSVCMPQYFPASHTFTDDQAKAVLKPTVDTIKDDLAFLRDSMARHADFLLSRWKKKSREKRSTFLKTPTQLFERRWGAVHLLDRARPLECTYAGPRMIPRVRTIRKAEGGYANTLEFHTPQSLLDANLREETLASYRDSWFLPYLDVETLSEDPTLFLSMLHHRSSNEPEKWLTFDNANLVLVEHFIIMSNISNRNRVVMQGPDYGKLVPWNAEQAHRWEIVGFTKAYVLLSAQRTMFNLLSKCVKGLLAEANTLPELGLNPKRDSMIASDFSRFKTNFPWSTDFVKPFSASRRFDAREISELILSRHRVVLDELELL